MTAADKTPKIVVSYRRSDSAMAGRIFDRLERRFGEQSLFIDIDSYGADFRKQIDDALTSSNLLIAMVDEKWLGRREGGGSRISDDSDPVRVEIETALARKIHILPVLLDNTKMPDPQDLPASIRNFAYLNAVDVESGRDFKVYVERLIGAIEQTLGIKSPSPAPAPSKRRDPKFMLIGAFLILGLVGTGARLLRDRFTSIGETASPEFCETLKKVIDESHLRFDSIL